MRQKSKLSEDLRSEFDRCKLTVNKRRFISLFDMVLKAKNESIAICTRESRRSNNRNDVKLTKLYL